MLAPWMLARTADQVAFGWKTRRTSMPYDSATAAMYSPLARLLLCIPLDGPTITTAFSRAAPWATRAPSGERPAAVTARTTASSSATSVAGRLRGAGRARVAWGTDGLRSAGHCGGGLGRPASPSDSPPGAVKPMPRWSGRAWLHRPVASEHHRGSVVPGRTAHHVARLPASDDAADGEEQVSEDEQQGEDQAPDPPASEPSSEPKRKRRRRTRLPATPQPPADVATGPSPWPAAEPVLIAEPASPQVRRGPSPWLVGALVLLVLVLAAGIGLGAAMLVPGIADADPPGSTIPPPAQTPTPPPPPTTDPGHDADAIAQPIPEPDSAHPCRGQG